MCCYCSYLWRVHVIISFLCYVVHTILCCVLTFFHDILKWWSETEIIVSGFVSRLTIIRTLRRRKLVLWSFACYLRSIIRFVYDVSFLFIFFSYICNCFILSDFWTFSVYDNRSFICLFLVNDIQLACFYTQMFFFVSALMRLRLQYIYIS